MNHEMMMGPETLLRFCLVKREKFLPSKSMQASETQVTLLDSFCSAYPQLKQFKLNKEKLSQYITEE